MSNHLTGIGAGRAEKPEAVNCGIKNDVKIRIDSSEATIKLTTDDQITDEGFELHVKQGKSTNH